MAKIPRANTEQSNNQQKLDFLYVVLVSVIIVLFIGFASMYVAFSALNNDSNGSKQATYQSLRDQVKDQNDKIDALTQSIEAQKK